MKLYTLGMTWAGVLGCALALGCGDGTSTPGTDGIGANGASLTQGDGTVKPALPTLGSKTSPVGHIKELTSLLSKTPATPVMKATPVPGLAALSNQAPVGVHEWGTFTSLQSAAGEDMPGLHHEEEPLPPFVHGRDGMCISGVKCMELIPGGVTQKMETPVIYFHGKPADGKPLTVKVDFPKGVISQWYPQAESFLPAVGALQNKHVAGGSMTWTVAVDPKGYNAPPVDAGDIWAPSRKVVSEKLRAKNEDESFIFYRGLGEFSLPVRVTSDINGTLTIKNTSAQDVPSAFLVQVTETGGAIQPLGALGKNATINAKDTLTVSDMDTFLADASTKLIAALVASGLTQDESKAMADTWTISYFHTPGLRILYVLPRSWTDELLPMTLSFKPHDLVRTLVGRIEVSTQSEENQIASMIRDFIKSGKAYWDIPYATEFAKLGRLVEPKLRAARKQFTDATELQFIDQAIGVVAEQN